MPLATHAWSQLAPATDPAERYLAALAYDATSLEVVLFGGYDGAARLADTLTWDGTNWTLLTPATSPTARNSHAMVYDATNTNVVLFGGDKSGSPFNDETWTWNGTTWTHEAPGTSPPGRNGHAMVYDPGAMKVWMFGGAKASGGPYNDLWSWDGTTWTDETPGTSPPARIGHALADTNLDDTWTLSSAGVWTHKTPANTPARNDDAARAPDYGRFFHALAYDDELALTLLYGGAQIGITRVRLGDTWIWDGTDWTEIVAVTGPPSRREGPSMVYDGTNGYALLFGGQGVGGTGTGDTFDETWIFDGPDPSTVASLRHTFGLA